MQPSNTWDAQLYNDRHNYVYDYGVGLIDLLAPKSHERILDLGCGSGELTSKIKVLADDVLGIDKSPEMIIKAKQQFSNIDFQVGDIQKFIVNEAFDALFSNATLHWVLAYEEAIRNMYASLKKGGRMVVEFGGNDNVRKIVEALRQCLCQWGYVSQSNLNLWYFPSVGEYATALESEGFTVTSAQWYDRPTALAEANSGIIDWLQMFAKPFFDRIATDDILKIQNQVQDSLRQVLFQDGIWYADYKRIRIVAYK